MRVRAAVLTVLAGAALAVPAAPAAAAACPAGGGVTVVVDFASLGGGTSRQCAPGDPATGLAALRAAGYTPTRAAQVPGYFVCRINGKPADDPCQRTSPADAYWSYWHAKPGGTWTYSSVGPADYDPAPGTVEGWAFGAGKPPSSPPPRAAAPAASASPRTSPAAAPPAATAAPRPSATLPAPGPTVTAGARQSPAPAQLPTPAASPSPSLDDLAGALTDDDPDPPLPRRGGASGPVLAAVVIALLLAIAGGTSLRRRRDGA